MLSTVTSHFHLSYNQNVANWSSPTLTSPKCMIISKNYLCCICTRMNPSIFETTHLQLKEPFHIHKKPSTIERTLKMLKLFKEAIFIKEYEAVLASRVVKAYICFEDEINECMVEELAVLKSLKYIFQGLYRQ